MKINLNEVRLNTQMTTDLIKKPIHPIMFEFYIFKQNVLLILFFATNSSSKENIGANRVRTSFV